MFPEEKGGQRDAEPPRDLPGNDTGTVFQLSVSHLCSRTVSRIAVQPVFLLRDAVSLTPGFPLLADCGPGLCSASPVPTQKLQTVLAIHIKTCCHRHLSYTSQGHASSASILSN